MTDEALLTEARAIDADAAAASAPPVDPNALPATPAAPPVDPIAEARELIDLGLALFVPMYPTLETVYTPEAKQKLAEKAGPLMAKYNLSGGAWAVKYKEEIGFAIVALPLVQKTVAAIKSDNAKAEKKPDAPGITTTVGGAAGSPPTKEPPRIGGDPNKDLVETFPANL